MVNCDNGNNMRRYASCRGIFIGCAATCGTGQPVRGAPRAKIGCRHEARAALPHLKGAEPIRICTKASSFL
jgi:hypothetical protein